MLNTYPASNELCEWCFVVYVKFSSVLLTRKNTIVLWIFLCVQYRFFREIFYIVCACMGIYFRMSWIYDDEHNVCFFEANFMPINCLWLHYWLNRLIQKIIELDKRKNDKNMKEMFQSCLLYPFYFLLLFLLFFFGFYKLNIRNSNWILFRFNFFFWQTWG